MSETRETGPAGRTGPRRTAMLLAALATLVLPAGLYLSAASLIAAGEGEALARIAAFDPDRTPSASIGRQALSGVMIVAAVGFLFVSPALLAMLALRRRASLRATALVGTLGLNSAALFVLLLILRSTLGVGRWPLLGGWWLWTLLLFALAWDRERAPEVLNGLLQRWSRTLAVGLACLLAGIIALFPEQALQCTTEDGTEAYELARSLRTHPLPAWELETWQLNLPSRIGTVVVNPALVNSYWTCASLTLLGDVEVAVRLPYWVWWLAIFLVGCRIVRSNSPAAEPESEDWLAAVPLGLLMLLVSVLFTFYTGYNPYMADLANPGVPNALFTLAVLCGFDALRQRSPAGFTVAMLLASLVLYAGPVLLLLTLAGAWIFEPLPRGDVRKWGLIAAGLLLLMAAVYLVVGVREGVFPTWIDMLDVEYLSDYLAPVSRVKSGLLFAGYFVLGCGGICVAGLPAAFRRDPWQRTVATAAAGYLLIVLLSGYKNLHYLGPLLPIPLLLFLASARAGRRRRRCLLASGSIVICLVLSWPAQRQTFTLNRQLGGKTTFATDSYLEAVQWGRLRLRLREQGLMSWDCDQHTWVAYSERDAALTSPRPLLVTATAPGIDAYRLVSLRPVEGTSVVAALFARDSDVLQWISRQHPLRPLERYPPLFRPLASGPYSPHDNRIEEARRLREWW